MTPDNHHLLRKEKKGFARDIAEKHIKNMCCVKTSIDLTFEYLMSYRKYLTEYFQKTNRHVLITVQVARNFKQVYHLPGVVYTGEFYA